MVEHLVKGVKRFQEGAFQEKQDLFQALTKGQQPDTLFITCSDSRIDPCLITQTIPGELFIVRNAGNLVPAHQASNGGEVATIDYAITVLKVKHIIVCGHTLCGAMKYLISAKSGNAASSVPGSIPQWLSHAEAVQQIVLEQYGHLSQEEQLLEAIRLNVKVQLKHLETFPSVAKAVAAGQLSLHGWVYFIGEGQVEVFEPSTGQFVPLANQLNSLAVVSSPL